MRHADNRRFGYAFVQHERAFDFCRSHAVPGNIDDIVNATSDPIIAITVPPRSIPGGIFSPRSEEHTSELQSLMRISYAVFCLKKKKTKTIPSHTKQFTHNNK